jgi:DNA-binding response OmpR family regulator
MHGGGANDYLTKPVDIDRLLTLLRVLLFKQEVAGKMRELTVTMG